MKTVETASAMQAMEALLARSAKKAGPALAQSVAWPPRAMTAAEVFEFWQRAKVVAMATVGEHGQPHSAPVHAVLAGNKLSVLVYENAVRRRDLATNPRVSFTSWDNEGAVVILSGLAHEVEASTRDARPSQGGEPRRVVEFEVTLTRAHAMRGKSSKKQEADSPPRND